MSKSNLMERIKVSGRTRRRLQYKSWSYLTSFLPAGSWLPRYQRRWLMGDLLSGITLGLMTVPQAIAYARLARIPVEHGLYSAFIGHLIYTFLGTSREISVAPSTAPCILISKAISEIQDAYPDKYTPAEIGSSVGLLFGIICLAFGIFRLGVLLDFIPNAVIVGFTAGLALNIMLSQLAPLLGIVVTKGGSSATWNTIAKVALGIPNLVWQNLVIGLISLVFLYGLLMVSNRLSRKFPMMIYLSISANAILVILATLIAFIILKVNPDAPISVIKDVPSGFGYIGPPVVNEELWSKLISHIPGLFLAIVLESSAVAKGFSRKYGYELAPSQEIFSFGICNIVAGFFSGFPSGGGVSRAAVLDRSGVKSPLSGLVVSLIVMASFLFLTPCFYYIPNATLAAIIFKAGLSLFPTLATLKSYWLAHPVDLSQFFLASLVTFFFGTEWGIISSVAAAFLFIIFRLARPEVIQLEESDDTPNLFTDKNSSVPSKPLGDGILGFRILEAIIFPNNSYVVDEIVTKCLSVTRPSSDEPSEIWSTDVYSRARRLRLTNAKIDGVIPIPDEKLPPLRAVLLDLSAVNWLDSSGLKGLEDLERQLKSYAGPTLQLHLVTTNATVVRCLKRTKLGHTIDEPHHHPYHSDLMKPTFTSVPPHPDNLEATTTHPSTLSPSRHAAITLDDGPTTLPPPPSDHLTFPIHPSIPAALTIIRS